MPQPNPGNGLVNAGLGVVMMAVWPGVTQVLVFGAVSVHVGTDTAGAARTTAVMVTSIGAISSMRAMASSVAGESP